MCGRGTGSKVYHTHPATYNMDWTPPPLFSLDMQLAMITTVSLATMEHFKPCSLSLIHSLIVTAAVTTMGVAAPSQLERKLFPGINMRKIPLSWSAVEELCLGH